VSDEGIALVLNGPEEIRVGQPIRLRVEIHNASNHGIWMVGVVDGSEGGVRFPRYAPSVMLDGRVVAAPPRSEDPLVGPLRVEDFHRLDPGESFDPTEPSHGAAYLPLSTFANFIPPTQGNYRFELSLSTESDSPERWLGRFNQEDERAPVLELIEKVPPVVVSAAFEIEAR
jgi:hypothetical protein